MVSTQPTLAAEIWQFPAVNRNEREGSPDVTRKPDAPTDLPLMRVFGVNVVSTDWTAS